MNYTKSNPKGLDYHIQAHQTALYNALKTLWSLSDSDMDFYGRAYRNKYEDGYTPEVYDGNGNYHSVLWDDSKKAMAFYGIKGARVIDSAQVNTQAYLIFMCNLDNLRPGDSRNDEEVREDVSKQCLYTQSGFEMKGMSTDGDIVFKEYSGYKTVKGMGFQDLHPYHYFRIDFNLIYPVYTNN